MAVNYRERIISLWTVFLLGILFHTELGLMPLFHGLSVAESQKATNINDISGIMWLMLGFFMLPMLAIISTAFTDSKRYRIVHFGLTIFYTIMNLLHVVSDLLVKPILWYQIVLIVFLFFVGLLLNITAFQWMRLHNTAHKLPKHLEGSLF